MTEPGRELKVSWTRLRDHMDCKQKAARKEEGKKSAATNIRVFFPGTVVDLCMRRWLAGERVPGTLPRGLADRMDEAEQHALETGDGVVKWKNPADKGEVEKTCYECLENLEPILAQVAPPGSVFWPAERFREELVIPHPDGSPQRVWLVGEMDLLTQPGPRTFGVYDLKMTRNDSYWRSVIGQLVFYELAVWIRQGVWPEQSSLIQPLCKQQLLPFRFTEQHRRELFAAVQRYCEDVWRGDQAPKAGIEGCGWCEVRQACVRYAAPPGRVPWPV
jgi:hypothetical protein